MADQATPATTTSDPTAAAPAQAVLPGLDSIIAKSIAAGNQAIAAEAQQVATAVETEPATAVETTVDVAPVEVPEPPKQVTDDPIAKMAKMIEALTARVEALTAPKPEPAEVEPKKKPEPERPKTLHDSPFKAQAAIYFGDDLPEPLMVHAVDVMQKRYGWQMELTAAESAKAAGDANADARIKAANAGLGQVDLAIKRIEHDASVARAIKPQPAASTWNTAARDERIDQVLAGPRDEWEPEVAALADYEIAMVLRGVHPGKSLQDFADRGRAAIFDYIAKKDAKPVESQTQPATPKAKAAPKNPAPPSPAKPESTLAGDTWNNNELPDMAAKIRRIVARGRGDVVTN